MDRNVVFKLERHLGALRAGQQMMEDADRLQRESEILSRCTVLGGFGRCVDFRSPFAQMLCMSRRQVKRSRTA